MTISFCDRVENNVGKRKKYAGYKHFLLFPQCFPKPSSLESLKVGIVWYRVKKFWGPNSKRQGFMKKGMQTNISNSMKMKESCPNW